MRDGYVVAHVIGGKVGGGSLDPALAKLAVASVDAAIAEVAEAQHGVAARAQLVELGVGARAIEHRLAMGRLHRIHRGVYAVGHRTLSAKSRWMAAVLACGEGSALSYRSAGPLWGVRLSSRTAIEVTTRPGRRPRPGIELHYDRLADDEVTVVDGIPVTTVARTLLDLACVLDRDRLERALNQAERLRLGDSVTLDQLLRRYPRRRGTATLRAILAEGRINGGITRAELEDRFLEFVDRFSLPKPELNAPLSLGDRWIEADCLWRAQRLIVELDDRWTHETTASFESDRARDRAALAAGWRVMRVTARQLREDPDRLAADLRSLLVEDAGSGRSATAS